MNAGDAEAADTVIHELLDRWRWESRVAVVVSSDGAFDVPLAAHRRSGVPAFLVTTGRPARRLRAAAPVHVVTDACAVRLAAEVIEGARSVQSRWPYLCSHSEGTGGRGQRRTPATSESPTARASGGIGYSDPTGVVAMDRAGDGVRDDGTEASMRRHEKMRRALYRSSAAVDRAVGVLRGALGELERAMGEREDDWSGARVPRMITAADPEAAKAAQGRRLARGEGWGEG